MIRTISAQCSMYREVFFFFFIHVGERMQQIRGRLSLNAHVSDGRETLTGCVHSRSLQPSSTV